MPPVVIHLVAAQSETGKTTFIEQLLPVLKERGLRVAALKGNLQQHNLDLPGKDSWRFAQAGAEIAGLTTPDAFLLTGSAPGKNGIEAATGLLGHLDLILIEGNKQTSNLKIELVRSAVNSEPILNENTIALVSDRKNFKLEIPVFDFCDTGPLADFIIKNYIHGKEINTGTGGDLTHFDPAGRPRMVDVSAKDQTLREAYARGEILMTAETLARVKAGSMSKGDVLGVAQVAAVMAVKETGRLIPMAHPLGISGVEVDFNPLEKPEPKIEIGVRVKLTGQTGVEMEALTGVSVAALTIYDMCKAVDKNMVIQSIRLVEKKGGRSGHYRREQS
jgi:cyclic pyranopterin monophosphate synthase